MHSAKTEQIIRLYRTMPGAPMPPTDDGFYLWGEVEGNDHWEFCKTIVELVDKHVGGALNVLASEHNLI